MDNQSGGGGCPQSPGPKSSVSHNKKQRRKRKELDALVGEDKLHRRKTLKNSSRHDLLQASDSDEVEFRSSRRLESGGIFSGPYTVSGCLPALCCMLILLATAAVAGATMKLLMVTRRDMEDLQARLNSVEASGSELPAKFHASHVRLQQLELNHTALWQTVSHMGELQREVQKKLSSIESGVKRLESSFSSSPELSSLPKDVSTLQESVATFGSSLKDVQSSLKLLGEKEVALEEKINRDGEALHNVQEFILSLKNLTSNLQQGREGVKMSLAEVLQSLRSDVTKVANDISTITKDFDQFNHTISTDVTDKHEAESTIKNLQTALSDSINNITKRIQLLESASSEMKTQDVVKSLTNITMDVNYIKDKLERQYRKIEDLSTNVAVVKGVERKLEGSQVQMASMVSELKQQIQKLESEVKQLTPHDGPTEKSVENSQLTRKSRETEPDMSEYRKKRHSQ